MSSITSSPPITSLDDVTQFLTRCQDQLGTMSMEEVIQKVAETKVVLIKDYCNSSLTTVVELASGVALTILAPAEGYWSHLIGLCTIGDAAYTLVKDAKFVDFCKDMNTLNDIRNCKIDNESTIETLLRIIPGLSAFIKQNMIWKLCSAGAGLLGVRAFFPFQAAKTLCGVSLASFIFGKTMSTITKSSLPSITSLKDLPPFLIDCRERLGTMPKQEVLQKVAEAKVVLIKGYCNSSLTTVVELVSGVALMILAPAEDYWSLLNWSHLIGLCTIGDAAYALVKDAKFADFCKDMNTLNGIRDCKVNNESTIEKMLRIKQRLVPFIRQNICDIISAGTGLLGMDYFFHLQVAKTCFVAVPAILAFGKWFY